MNFYILFCVLNQFNCSNNLHELISDVCRVLRGNPYVHSSRYSKNEPSEQESLAKDPKKDEQTKPEKNILPFRTHLHRRMAENTLIQSGNI